MPDNKTLAKEIADELMKYPILNRNQMEALVFMKLEEKKNATAIQSS